MRKDFRLFVGKRASISSAGGRKEDLNLAWHPWVGNKCKQLKVE